MRDVLLNLLNELIKKTRCEALQRVRSIYLYLCTNARFYLSHDFNLELYFRFFDKQRFSNSRLEITRFLVLPLHICEYQRCRRPCISIHLFFAAWKVLNIQCSFYIRNSKPLDSDSK